MINWDKPIRTKKDHYSAEIYDEDNEKYMVRINIGKNQILKVFSPDGECNESSLNLENIK